MTVAHSISCSLLVVLVIGLGGFRVEAQVDPATARITIRGKITGLTGQELLVATANGQIAVKAFDLATIRGEVPIKLSDIAPGMYLGTTARKQPDGTFRAAAIHIFSEDQRGLSEGHKPSSSVPDSTMTNATVETVEELAVQEVKGRMMTLKYKGGEVKVFVPPNTSIVKRVQGDREMLKPGADVTIQGTQAADGSISASQIVVRASGSNPPM